MKPAVYDTKVIRGTIWEFTFTWKDSLGVARNLAGYTATAIFTEAGGGASVGADISSINNPAGSVHVKLEESVTAAIPWDEGTWRLTVIEPDGDPITLITGQAPVR